MMGVGVRKALTASECKNWPKTTTSSIPFASPDLSLSASESAKTPNARAATGNALSAFIRHRTLNIFLLYSS